MPSNDLTTVLAEAGVLRAEELLCPHWPDSVASFPVDGVPFLAPDEVRRNRELGGLGPDADPVLLDTARALARNRSLAALAWHCYRLLYTHLDYDAGQIQRWPDLDDVLGDRSRLFYLLIALAAVPLAMAKYRELGIPEEIIAVTCRDVTADVDLNARQTGRLGALPRLLGWLRNHTTGILYRIGRFQYMIKPFRGRLRAFRHCETDRVTALAAADLVLNERGLMWPGVTPGSAGAWTTRFGEDDRSWRGHLVSPLGHVLGGETTLWKDEWRLALAEGDPVLEIHIPPGGGMTPQRCRDSMRQALDFAARHFPDQPVKGLACTSWILNPRFSAILPPEANLRRFEEEVHLFPIPSNGKAGLFFIFGADDVDPATAPRDTSIRRVLLDELESGTPLLNGGMFLLAEDMPHFGTQHYRRQWPFAVP